MLTDNDRKDREQDRAFEQSQPDRTENKQDKSRGEAQEKEAFDTLDTFESSDQSAEPANPDWKTEMSGSFADPEIKKTKKPISRFKKALLILAGLLILGLAAAGTYVMAFYSDIREPQRILLDEVNFEEKAGNGAEDEGYDVDAAFYNHIVNVALLGFDRGWGREKMGEELFRPDALAIFSIDFEKEEVSVVRIPRDSYVPIHGMGNMHDKINHSYYYGYHYGDQEDPHQAGIEYTIQTVSNVLGNIPIHYYVSVDMYSVIELVDAMGGIYYEVEETIYDEHWDIGRVLVPEGPQIMDGKTYLRYLQYRGDTGDTGRIDRQMSLLKETFKYLREEGRITDIPATYRIYKDYVETDLTYTQIAAIAYFARDLDLSNESLHFHTLPGDHQTKDGIYYMVLKQDERLRIIEEAFGVEAERWAHIVLEDSPEYIEEQERKRREEEGEEKERARDSIFDDDWFNDRDDQDQDRPEENVDQSGDTGQDLKAVPELRGMSVQEAEAALRESGFRVGEIREAYYDRLDPGLVWRSEPSVGTEAQAGAIIDLIVSSESEPDNDDNDHDDDADHADDQETGAGQ